MLTYYAVILYKQFRRIHTIYRIKPVQQQIVCATLNAFLKIHQLPNTIDRHRSGCVSTFILQKIFQRNSPCIPFHQNERATEWKEATNFTTTTLNSFSQTFYLLIEIAKRRHYMFCSAFKKPPRSNHFTDRRRNDAPPKIKSKPNLFTFSIS